MHDLTRRTVKLHPVSHSYRYVVQVPMSLAGKETVKLKIGQRLCGKMPKTTEFDQSEVKTLFFT